MKEVVFFNASSVADGYSDLLPNKTERNQTRVRVKVLPQLQTILNELTPDQDGNFFPDMIAKYKRDRAHVNREFMSILEKMKLHVPGDGYGFHSIRHTYITEGIDAGIDVKSIQATAGQSSLKVTEGTYYHGIKDADISNRPVL